MSVRAGNERAAGQILIVFAILILIMVFFLAWIVDGGRIAIRRAETRRGAEAAANAGMVVVGNQMLTQAVARQTEAAGRPPCAPEAGYGTPAPNCTATPQIRDIPAWLTDDDRATLVSPAVQTPVAAAAQDYAARNNVGPASTNIVEFSVIYPFDYQAQAREIRLNIRIRRAISILLAGVLNRTQAELAEESIATLPQRK